MLTNEIAEALKRLANALNKLVKALKKLAEKLTYPARASQKGAGKRKNKRQKDGNTSYFYTHFQGGTYSF
ncbi:MAG: hypothetical protein K5979_02165 [Ruminococcus sp.]|nr:hypothetical protein [Ruminococcus sp.]